MVMSTRTFNSHISEIALIKDNKFSQGKLLRKMYIDQSQGNFPEYIRLDRHKTKYTYGVSDDPDASLSSGLWQQYLDVSTPQQYLVSAVPHIGQ